MATIRVERQSGALIIGRMVGTEWNYAAVPEAVAETKGIFEGWIAKMMGEHQPDVRYEIEYQDHIWG